MAAYSGGCAPRSSWLKGHLSACFPTKLRASLVSTAFRSSFRPFFPMSRLFFIPFHRFAIAFAVILLASLVAKTSAEERRKSERPKHLVAQVKPGAPGISPEQIPSVLPAGKPEKTSDPSGSPIFHARPGPWGDLDYFTVYLEASASMLKTMDFQSYDTTWKFVKWTDDQVGQLFESAKLTEPFKAELLDRTKWRRDAEGVTVVPSREAVLGLGKVGRRRSRGSSGNWTMSLRSIRCFTRRRSPAIGARASSHPAT